MGKKIIIKDADFSANAIEKDATWETVLSGSITNDGSGNSFYIPLEPILPSGTVTRVTATLSTTGSAAIGGIDTEDVPHTNYWFEIFSEGTMSGEKTLTFDMAKFNVWTPTVGATVEYKLEKLVQD